MVWKKRKKRKKVKFKYSISKELQEEGLSNDKFEIMLNNLHIEDIIALKLELSSKNAAYYLYGVPIWSSIEEIVKEAIYKFAVSNCGNRAEVCDFLNISPYAFYNLKKTYIGKNIEKN